MDRSFLSQPEVITATRNFVCVRLATYENQAEADFLTSLLTTRSGELENTVFTVLSPDGKRQLVRASRSARQSFGEASRMAETLIRIAGEFRASQAAAGRVPELPRMASVRLALNVAACDNRPLVVLLAGDGDGRRVLEERLAQLAWSDTFLGQFTYAVAEGPGDLGTIAGVGGATAGVFVVQPDRFGQKGQVLAQAGGNATADALAQCLREGWSRAQREAKSFGSHVQEGRRLGILWETAIPVTDPMERQARQRGRD